ncbi:---NA--- [Paramuricea clavata]|uniref:---NA n=1 Tax=Paramuricea clavata TaxID=317549 RepID=A0A7D9HFF5_PARCT|nr:---NA--- [Paramuricea clavata]
MTYPPSTFVLKPPIKGENIHNIASTGVCDLNSIVRVGDNLRWKNPTNQTLYITGEECHTRLNIVIPPEQTATYVFQIRGICQYRSSACPTEVGILNVKGRIERRSIVSIPPSAGCKDKACTAFCKGTQIKPADVTSSSLCQYQYDYVVRGVVNRYYTQQLKISSKDNVELSVKHDYLKPVCQSNCPTIATYKLSFLWMPSSQNCTCPRLKIGSEILVMGFRSGTKFAIDTRSKSLNWDSKIAKNLLAYQHKVNRDPPCS